MEQEKKQPDVKLGQFFINWESKQTKKYAKEALKNLSHKFLKR